MEKIEERRQSLQITDYKHGRIKQKKKKVGNKDSAIRRPNILVLVV